MTFPSSLALVTRIFYCASIEKREIDRYVCTIRKKIFNFIKSRNDVTRSYKLYTVDDTSYF